MSRFRKTLCLKRDAEITVECAPGTLSAAMIEALQRCGVNRVSLGVQSFVDIEAASVGRLHKRATVLDDIARLRAAGIENINIDLIAGLPHQTPKAGSFPSPKRSPPARLTSAFTCSRWTRIPGWAAS